MPLKGKHDKDASPARERAEHARLEKVLEGFRKSADHENVALTLEAMHDYAGAARAYEEAGKVPEAIRMYETFLSSLDPAGRKKATREMERLTSLYLQTGERAKAASLYSEMGKDEDARDLLEKSGQPLRAARLAEKSGQWKEAATLYERCQRFAEAARLYKKATLPLEAARVLEKCKNLYGAALLYERDPGTLFQSAQILKDTLAGRQSWRQSTRYPVMDLAVARKADRLAAGLENGTIFLTDTKNGASSRLRMPQGASVSCLAISEDGKVLAGGSPGGTFVVVDDQKNVVWEGNVRSAVESVALTGDGNVLALGLDDGTVQYSRPKEKKVLWTFQAPFTVWSVSLTGNGDRLAVGSGDQFVYVLDARGTLLWKRGFEQWVHTVEWSPDGAVLVAGVGDDFLCALDSLDGKVLWMQDLGFSIHDISFSSDSETFAVAAHEQAFLLDRHGKVRWSKPFPEKVYRVGRGKSAGETLLAFALQDFACVSLHPLKKRAARNFENGGCFEEAAEILEELGEYSHSLELYTSAGSSLGVARSLERLGKTEEAAEKYLETGKTQEAASLYEKLGNLDKAVSIYQSIGLDSKAAELSERLGNTAVAARSYRESGELKKAAELFTTLGEADEAIDCFRRHLAQSPEDMDSSSMFADLLIGKGEYREAIQVLQRLLAVEKYRRETLRRLATCFSHEKLYDIAVSRYEEYLGKDARVDSTTKEPFYQLALLYETLGQYDKAETIFADILATDYQFRDAKDRLEKVKELRSVYREPGSAGRPSADKTVVYQDLSPEFKARYQVVKKLGEGGMGSVFVAKDTRLGRTVALKVIRPQFARDPNFRLRFLREARAAAAVQHPNIVQVFDAGEERDTHFISMEFVEGESVRQILARSRPMAVEEALEITIQAAEALDCAHSSGIVHRDIKPDNIMRLKESKSIKVMDFGLARVDTETQMTATGAILGSWLYMSPEQTRGEKVDQRSDIYSLGITLYEMLVGRPPFTEGDLSFHHVHTPPRPPRETNDKIPPSLNDFLLRMIAKSPDDRPASAKEVGKTLREILGEIRGTP